MSPSCSNGLTRIGFPIDLRDNTNISPLKSIQNLATGRLARAQSTSDYNLCVTLDNDAAAAESIPLPNVEVRPSNGRGLGLFAVDDIPAYTRILEDHALLSLASGEDIPELWQKYRTLSVEEKQQFDELGYSSHQLAKESHIIEALKTRGYEDDEAKYMVRVSSRFMANAFKEDSRWRATLFLTVARINHSCTPNAQTHYRPASGAKMLYSFRDIKAGEEMEISYFGVTMAYSDRQNRAKSWGFTCACPACSITGVYRNDDYERALSRIRGVLEIGANGLDDHNPAEELIYDGRTAIKVALNPEYPWLVAALPNLYIYLGLWLGQEPGSEVERRAALASALEWESKITGPDSPFSEDKRRQLERLVMNTESG